MISLEESGEFRETGFGIRTIGRTIGGMLEIGYPEVFRVEGCEEGFSGDSEGAGSADGDEVGSFEMFHCEDDFTGHFDIWHYR